MPEVGIKFKLDNTTLKNSLKEATSSLQKFNKENQVKEKNLKNLMKLESTSNNAKQKNILLMEKETRLIKTQTSEYAKLGNKIKNTITSNKVTGAGLGRGVSLGLGGLGGMMGGLVSVYTAQRMISGASDRQAEWSQISNALSSDVSSATKSDVQNIAMQSGQTNVDVIRAFYDALSSAFSEEASKAITKTSATVATALKGNIVDTQDIIISTAKAYNITDQAGIENIGNLLSGTVKASRGTIGEIAQNAGQFMPFSSQYGISLEDTLAAFSAITLKVGNVAESATALKNFFTQINQGNDTLAKYKITGQTLREEGLQKTLDKLSKVLEKDKNLFDELFPNIRAGLAGASLIDGGVLQQSKDIIATGNISEEFNRTTNNVGVNMTRLSNQFENTVDTFFESTNTLQNITTVLRDMTPYIQNFGETIKSWRQNWDDKLKPEIIKGDAYRNLIGNTTKEKLGLNKTPLELAQMTKEGKNAYFAREKRAINVLTGGSELTPETLKSLMPSTEELKKGFGAGVYEGSKEFFDNFSLGIQEMVNVWKIKMNGVQSMSKTNKDASIYGPKPKEFYQ